MRTGPGANMEGTRIAKPRILISPEMRCGVAEEDARWHYYLSHLDVHRTQTLDIPLSSATKVAI